ncbi:leucine-rich repeat neuronal protein 1-like [Portunus trituberculatus]|uniref:leucine-rich repeat neuronal protein 1-like n=1 Tax=Portunus trituberculatus TaxID=210409 RepID=UPI001E1CEEF0|nr:leucine-rich repeat neuronal protein 1-like [Portunus trituberculatus]
MGPGWHVRTSLAVVLVVLWRWVQAGEVQAGDVQAGGLQPTEMQAGGVQAGGLQPTEMQAGGVQAGGLQPTEMQAGGLQPMEVQAVEVQPGGVQAGVQATEIQPGGVEGGGMQDEVQNEELQAVGTEAGKTQPTAVQTEEQDGGVQTTDAPTSSMQTEEVQAATAASNATCVAGCACGLVRSLRLQQELYMLNCSFAGLKSFPEALPADLEALSVRGNAITHVLDSLARLTELRELDLSGNKIKSIGRGGMFQNLSRLLHLDMAKNTISTIFRDNLMGPRALLHLELANNKINYIEDEALADLSSLLTLDLRQNLLGSLYEEWFHGLRRLHTLDLTHNRIHNIPASVFRALASLHHLNLSGNRISSVDPRAFSGLTRLQELVLEDNLLASVPTAALQSLPSLSVLTVDHNPLNKIKPLDFSHLSAARISVRHMPDLRIVDPKAFYNLVNATTLLLSGNPRLAYVDPLAFMNVDALRDLQLHDNHLRGLQKEIADYLPQGVTLTLYGNPLTCDCNARWLRRMVAQRTNASVVLREPQRLVCHTPPARAHKLLKDLQLMRLDKSCAPTVLNLTQSRVVVGKVGGYQVLECRALGSPSPRLHWLLPDGSIVNSTLNEVRRRFFPPCTLIHYHLRAADEGPYTCVAENECAVSRGTVWLTVAGLDIHLFPIRISSTFITLVWNGTERRAFPSYKIFHTEVDENGTAVGEQRASETSPARKTFTINHLQPDTRYRFCLGNEDASGYWLEISCCVAATEDLQFMLQGISRTSNAAVAAMVGLVLAMTVAVCLLSVVSRRYRQRFYESPDKSGSQGATVPLVHLCRPIMPAS